MSVDAGSINVKLTGDASGAVSAANSVTSAMQNMAEVIGGIAIFDALRSGIEQVQGALEGLASSVMSVSASLETFNVSMGVLFDNAGIGAQSTNAAMQTTSAGITSAGNSIARAQQSMADAAQDHARALAQIGEESAKAAADLQTHLAEMAQAYQQTMADMQSAHDETIQSIENQEANATQQFNEQQAQRQRSFDEAMQSLVESHQQAMQSLQDQLAKVVETASEKFDQLTATYQQKLAALQTQFADQLDKAPDSFEAQRAASERTAKSLQADLDAEVSKGGSADQALIASLRRRIDEEQSVHNESYSQYVAGLQSEQQAKVDAEKAKYDTEVASLKRTTDAQEAALKTRMANEDRSYAERKAKLEENYAYETARAQEAYTKEMGDLQKRMADEQKLYDENLTKKEETYAKDVAAAKQAEADKLKALQERLAQEDLMYARHIRDLQQIEATAGAKAATGASKGNRFGDITAARAQAMTQETQDLEALSGHSITNKEQFEKALDDFLQNSTFGTPFNVTQLRAAAATAQGFGVNPVQWMQTISNTAAFARGINPMVTPQFIADLLGRINTGYGGYAAREFGALGIPLQGIPGLNFSKQNELLNTPAQALPLIQSFLNSQFQGMALQQSKTLPGIMSNFQDWGILIAQLLGGQEVPTGPADVAGTGQPLEGGGGAAHRKGSATKTVGVYTDIENMLAGIYDWSTKNKDAIIGVATAIGTTLHQAFLDLKPELDKVVKTFEDWVGSGQAKKDIQTFGDELIKVIDALKKWVDSGGADKLVKAFTDIATQIHLAAVDFKTVSDMWTTFSSKPPEATTSPAIVHLLGLDDPALNETIDKITNFLKTPVDTTFEDTFNKLWANIKETVITTWADITGFLAPALRQVEQFFVNVWTGIRKAIGESILSAALSVAGTLNSLINTLQTFIDSVIDAFNTFVQKSLGLLNQVRAALFMSPIDFKPIQYPVLGTLDTTGIQAALAALQALQAPIVPPLITTYTYGGIDNQLPGAPKRIDPGAPVTVNNTIHVQLDGRQVAQSVRQQLILTQQRNVTSGIS